MLIGVVADTHVPKRARALPGPLLRGLAGVELILHAGDLVDASVLNTLAHIAPVLAVAGNNDPPALNLPLTRVVEVGSWRIGMAHGHEGAGQTTVAKALSHFHDVHCVVFGHSHIPYSQDHGGVLAFNPGSPTDRRRSPRFSYGILRVSADGIAAELIYFDRE